jgi:hypothetical protein
VGCPIVESHHLVKVGYLIPRNVTDGAAKFVDSLQFGGRDGVKSAG